MHPKSVKDRAIVHYLHFLPSLRRVSRVYGVGKSTLGRWIKTNSAKVDKPASRVPLHRKIAEMVGKITQNDPFGKGHHVVSQLRQQGIKASEATVSRARHVAGYSRKRVRACYLPKPPTQEAATQYLATLKGAPEALAIDETHILDVNHVIEEAYAIRHAPPSPPQSQSQSPSQTPPPQPRRGGGGGSREINAVPYLIVAIMAAIVNSVVL